jgi:ABC-type antimicrobial peptide transport system permease subunit
MESSLGNDLVQVAKEAGGAEVMRVAPMIFRRLRIEDRVMQIRAGTKEDMEVVNRLRLIQGNWPQADDELIASEGAIQITHWPLGKVIKVYGSDFHLVGVAEAYGSRYSSLWMTLNAGLKLFGPRRGYQIILMQLRPGSDAEQVLATVETSIKKAGRYSAYLEDQVGGRYYQSTNTFRRLNLVENIIALLAIMFGAYNGTSLILIERSRELSILRVVGFRIGKLRVFLLGRAILQILLAYLVGLAVALLFVQNRQLFNPIVIQAQSMPLSLPVWGVISALALVICFSALGVWFPTRSYFHISVAEQARG